MLAAMLAFRFLSRTHNAMRVAGNTTEFIAITAFMTMAFTVFSYLCMAASGALVDRQLEAIDQAMGFDWLAGWHLLRAHPAMFNALRLLYNSLAWQALYLSILLGIMGRNGVLRELFWLLFIAAMLTGLIAMFFPAYGPFETFGLPAHGGFLPDMKHLKSGFDLHFALDKMTGVICFPSFHTVMALIYAYGFRKTGVIGYAIAGVNFVMLLSVPFMGGHYLIDMIAGAGVTLVSLAVVKTAPLLWRRFNAGYASPVSVAACGDAYSADAPSR
ncbi:MAG TPA: phosphatase PAP2 family protein [Rhizomicrobium sp.]|nr:phosphatase PAP2 family protein [Rhizomicrobium sp.]